MLSLTFFGLGWKGIEDAEGIWIHLISESSHFESGGRKGASAIHEGFSSSPLEIRVFDFCP